MNNTRNNTMNKNSSRRRASQSGFTLIELSVVLAVIGLIIGAMAIGKDVQRNAEFTKIKNKFVDQWEQSYNQYYQRTGVVLGDSQVQPRMMVNGTNFAAGAGLPISGGDMSGAGLADGVDRICETADGNGMIVRTGATAPSLRDEMTQAGVRMAPGRAEGHEDRYAYLDSNGNPQEVQVCFQWNNAGNFEGAGNVMILSGLTPELARMLDQMVDGKPDAQEGRFRQQGVANGTPNGPGEQWSQNNDSGFVAGVTAFATAGADLKLDEQQVATLVAVYKMNQ
jgi:prepilin-type N-terminal cleavage/methylation domain-containing protein